MDWKVSERELAVIRLVAEGKTNEQIGRQLAIATATVKAHLVRIAFKLRTHNRAEIVFWAAKERVLDQRNGDQNSLEQLRNV